MSKEKTTELIQKNQVKNFRSGFVALIGRPNVGKSTFLNHVLGKKISIVSPKPQTTRDRIIGIVSKPEFELIFVDTPGLHKAESKLNHYMVQTAEQSLLDADVVVWMLDISNENLDGRLSYPSRKTYELINQSKKPIITVLNKIDKIAKLHLLPFIDQLSKLNGISEIIPISALQDDGIEKVVNACKSFLPFSEHRFYAENQITDLNEQKAITEFIREQLFLQLDQEIPYSTAVTLDQVVSIGEAEENQQSLPQKNKTQSNTQKLEIAATIYVEKPNQRAIILGHQGERIKQIRAHATRQIKKYLERPVTLKLFVKCVEDWHDRDHYLKELGYRTSQK